MLDEIDKLGARLPRRPGGGAARGARSRAEQHASRDHYLEVPFDLSKVHVHRHGEHRSTRSRRRSATAWRSSSSPATRATRSCSIARQHLVPKQLEEHGLTAEQLEITDEARRRGHRRATRARPACATSSARSRASAAASRCKVAEGKTDSHADRRPRTGAASILGPQKFMSRGRRAHRGAGRRHGPRLDAASAATSSSSRPRKMPGKGTLTLTGQLGDVMKESAQAALSLRAQPRPKWLGIDANFLEKTRHPRPRPGGRDPQGRPVRGRHHVHRAGLAADRHAASATTWR